jgi:hypothetical protein
MIKLLSKSKRYRVTLKVSLPDTVSGSPRTLAEILNCQRPAIVRGALKA